MDLKSAVNITICGVGILIFLVHIVNLIVKKNKRNDENCLLLFMTFTAIHFASYLTFVAIRAYYTSDIYIKTCYTIFYIMNNLEVFLLFIYMLSYVVIPNIRKKRLEVFNIIAFATFVVLDIINIFTGFFFTAENGNYVRGDLMVLSQLYQFVMLAIVFFVAILNKKLNIREKVAFSIYCLFPLVAIIFQNIYKGYAIAYVSIIVTVEILFFFVNVERNIVLANEEEKNKEAQIKLMLSQIQPHFIYNSLSAISTLITIDPEKAQESLDDFTDYLRSNLSSLTETRLIPFTNELKHIKTYVSLEKMRFNDRINVIYDIGTVDFSIPPLTIQPIVENAIKHGILKKIKGGTVTLTTYETDTSIVIEVKDDGIGFDMSDIDFDENLHFGLKNISYRINQTCDGDLKITSKKGIGTKITVVFKK